MFFIPSSRFLFRPYDVTISSNLVFVHCSIQFQLRHFLRLEEEYWRSPFFLINFIGVIFEAGNETREKIWSDFGAEHEERSEKRVVFVHSVVFERAKN